LCQQSEYYNWLLVVIPGFNCICPGFEGMLSEESYWNWG